MALYTGKGDKGTSKTLSTEKSVRISKADPIFEALGSLDEINSYLGLVKVACIESGFRVEPNGATLADIVHNLQMDLFIVQAELAGAAMQINEKKVEHLSGIVNMIETQMPPITTFFVSGGTEIASLCDVARTLARRAERRVIAVHEFSDQRVNEHTLAFLNRLSSVLYALARYTNHRSDIAEISPTYQ